MICERCKKEMKPTISGLCEKCKTKLMRQDIDVLYKPYIRNECWICGCKIRKSLKRYIKMGNCCKKCF